jgi:methylthioribose-1-phosphate isomerase
MGVSVRNPAFDVTPAELVTAMITDKGIVHNPNIQNVVDLFNSKKALL